MPWIHGHHLLPLSYHLLLLLHPSFFSFFCLNSANISKLLRLSKAKFYFLVLVEDLAGLVADVIAGAVG